MRKKYNTIKTLAAFTALASSTVPLYSQARVRALPSIELNFSVLENLKQPKTTTHTVKIKKEHISKDLRKVATPALKPTPKEIKKQEVAPKKATTDQKTDTPIKNEVLEPSTKTPPIVIKNYDNTPNELPAELPEEKKADSEKNHFGTFSNFFKNIPFLSEKTKPDVAIAPAKTDDVIEAIESDASSLKEDNTNKKPLDLGINKDSNIKTPIKKTTEILPSTDETSKAEEERNKAQSSAPKPHLKQSTSNAPKEKNPEPKKQAEAPLKITPAESNITKNEAKETAAQPAVLKQNGIKHPEPSVKINKPEVITKPEVIEATQPAPIENEEGANDSMWQKFLENARKKASQAEPRDVSPKDEEKSRDSVFFKKPTPPLPMIVLQPSERDNKKTEAKVIEDKPSKPEPLEPISSPALQKEEATQAIETPKPLEELKALPLAAEEKKELSQKAEHQAKVIQIADPKEVGKKNHEAPTPVIVKQEKGFLSSFIDNLPSFSGDKKAPKTEVTTKDPVVPEIPEIKEIPITSEVKLPNISIEDKMAESKQIIEEKTKEKLAPLEFIDIDKNTDKKLGETIDRSIISQEIAKIPPVPEAAIIPIETSKTPAPENAQVITLKEIEKDKKEAGAAPIKQQNLMSKDILLSVAFDGNGISISDADKDRLNQLVKEILNSGKRLKVMSYARGADGEVNSSRRISLQRAIAVRSQMIQAGLEKTRINVQAVGNNTEDPEFSNSVNIYIIE